MAFCIPRWLCITMPGAGISLLVFPAVLAAPPLVDLPYDPPFGGTAIHPNVLLSLSAGFTIARNAYPGLATHPYDPASTYDGYFNSNKCYRYTGQYFTIAGTARDQHACGTSAAPFSGNFLNWSTTSVLDGLRLALTGGDRTIDTPSQTVLQRAWLPPAFYKGTFAWHTARGSDIISNATGIHATQIYVSNCQDKFFISDAMPLDASGTPTASCEQPQQTVSGQAHTYFARVEVCAAAEAGERALCRPYAQGHKPAGVLQQHAHRLRFGVMGYLADDPPTYTDKDPRITTDPQYLPNRYTAATRYGGVLRAPLKHLGEVRFTLPGFARDTNPNKEWDPQTGVLLANPDNAASYNRSGMINYLNQFGSNGHYKAIAPAGELYYEGMRYLQGKKPTGATSSNPLGNAYFGSAQSLEGLPAHSWNDPVLAACQQHHVLLVGDTRPQFDWYLPGGQSAPHYSSLQGQPNPRPTSRPAESTDPNVTAWTNRVGNLEQTSNLAGQTTGSLNEGSYYMAGVAYWANTTDIRQDRPVKVRTTVIDLDEQGNGTLDAPRQPRRSALYLAAKYGGFADRNKDGNPYTTTSGRQQTVTNDSEWTSSQDKRPLTYFLASTPDTIVRSISTFFAGIHNTAVYPPGAATSSSTLHAGKNNTYLYQAGYTLPGWRGTLQKVAVQRDANGQATRSETAVWEAGDILDNTPPDARNIFIGQQLGTTLQTVPFRWDALSETSKTLLDTAPYSANGYRDNLGQQRLAFLRGSKDMPQFRERAALLGDIINSTPVYVAAPSGKISDDQYSTFHAQYRKRTAAVYVGANDGMLHAFNARNGTELFAYIPAALTGKLGQLTEPGYTHRTYVDGPLVAGEARGAGGRWMTALVGGFGNAHQGVFALDITDPATFGTTHQALWEFTDADDPDIGYVLGSPQIVRIAIGTDAKGKIAYRYFALVTSGINNYEADQHANARGDNALFLLALDKPSSEAWQQGVNYVKFIAPIQAASQANGMGAAAVVNTREGTLSHVYAGDLQGNVWRVDFNGITSMAQLTQRARMPQANQLRILFTARNARGQIQPALMPPTVVHGIDGGYLLTFATGSHLAPDDFLPASYATQTLYMLHDNGHDRISGRDQLEERTATLVSGGNAVEIHGRPFRYTGTGSKHGWYLDLPGSQATGERGMMAPVAANGLLFFNSMLPAQDLCSTGSSRLYTFNLLTGMAYQDRPTGTLSSNGIPGRPMVFMTDDGPGDDGDDTGSGKGMSVMHTGTNPSEGGTGKNVTSPAQQSGRLSWREILNWQEMHDQLSD